MDSSQFDNGDDVNNSDVPMSLEDAWQHLEHAAYLCEQVEVASFCDVFWGQLNTIESEEAFGRVRAILGIIENVAEYIDGIACRIPGSFVR